MKIMRSIYEIEQLELPISKQVIQHLTEPFGFDIGMAQSMWDETSTALYVIELFDTDESLELEDESVKYTLRFVQSYPEYVDDIGGRYLLALTIFTDDGGGCYVLAPIDSKTEIVTELKSYL
ncbi:MULTISPECIES: hypothetical protein [unclassified Vibrio]|uniref:hypothetical protein n=1 Tax=unclassified Vibrio TaxID=2614977 RepID=UPI0035524218